MTSPLLSDRMFHRIMRELVDTGRAPHYAELGRDLGLDVDTARGLLHEVMRAYPIGWLHPDTDYIASFPPLNSLPTQYRVTVRGTQRWFAQCGFEATSVTWLFPGETVRIDAPCLDCGEPLTVEMRDGRLGRVDPPGIVGHLNYGFGASRGRPPYLCTGMNLFRSEEHARRWSVFQARAEEGFIALPELAGFFGTESRHHMLDADYLSVWYPRRAEERRRYLERLGKTSPFWLGTPDPA